MKISLFPESTRLASRYAIALLCAVVAVAGLAACGSGGGGASSATATAASAPTGATTTPAITTSATPAPAARTAPKAPSSAGSSSSGGTGGGAASFRESHGDNSIPDFGSEAPLAERERAATTLAAFLAARAGGEWAKACPYLARATRAQVEKFAGATTKGNAVACGTALRALSGGGGGGTSGLRGETLAGAPAALRVGGKSAFALYYGRDKSKYVMPMVKEGDAWKVSQLAPLSYPLGASGGAP